MGKELNDGKIGGSFFEDGIEGRGVQIHGVVPAIAIVAGDFSDRSRYRASQTHSEEQGKDREPNHRNEIGKEDC